ncbi:MAG: polysaccharide deacetylase family protein [Clostridia bacterium]|nr:polysaccharide deacetylase family protein [Clostridia bacterium]
MKSKKWLTMFFSTVAVILALIGVFNYTTDPFGVFGDKIMNWYSYDITNNPRTAKISYLDEHYADYDSYIIGCSSTSSFPTEDFGKYLDAKFYNMIMYGADMLDVEQTVSYMIKNYTVKNLVVNVYIDNGAVYNEESNKYTHSMMPRVDGSDPLGFYSRFLFATPSYGVAKLKAYQTRTWLSQYYNIFDEKTGAYDKRRRDIEPISDMDNYYKVYPEFIDYPHGNYLLPAVDDCIKSMENIVSMCEDNGVNLIVVAAPVYYEYMNNFYPDSVCAFYTCLAEVVDFWDFSYSSVSFEPRYFYDRTHFRNNVGHMAAARIFGDESVYIPDDFGHLVTAENAEVYFGTYFDAKQLDTADYTKDVPVLMYHNIAEEPNDMTVTPETFRMHMETLAENGYTAVTLDDMVNYVYSGGELPEKPVLITFDDGYYSNYEYAYPVLSELGMKAVIFTVGTSFGKTTYLDTDAPITPHFGEKEAKEMTNSGVISLQSHTYDMHRSENYEKNARYDMGQLAGETEEEYIDTVREDLIMSREFLENLREDNVLALSYPKGKITDNAARIAVEEGYTVTFSTNWGVQELVRGLGQSLYAVKRNHISNDVTSERLLEIVQGIN